MAHPADEILSAMRTVTAEDRAVIQKAYDVAERVHGAEVRKSGDAYITHPYAIALHLARLGMDRDTIVAGILHDTIEDTPYTADELERDFGATVRFLVEGVTKLSKLKYRGLDRHIESLRRLLVATAADIRVIIIKLADRLHNMETIRFVTPPEKRTRIAKETMEVYVPVAERLGMSTFRTALEDLAFKELEPEKYEETRTVLVKRRQELESALAEGLRDVRRKLGEAGMRTFRTEMRIKGVRSLAIKLKEKENNIDKVYDLFAFRIIVPTVEDCYRVMGILHAAWTPVPGRIKDYIATPKPNGYRSLHTVVITDRGLTAEMQIRTEEMHRESLYGVASHLAYKGKTPQEVEERTTWLKYLMPRLMRTKAASATSEPAAPQWLNELGSAVTIDESNEGFADALKEDFFARRMFVFTPKGDAIDLPVGATAVDFAYAVHSELGDTMVGAKANGKIIQLNAPLQNGSIIEIIRKKSGKPNLKWLEFAKTSGAKKHIKSAFQKPE